MKSGQAGGARQGSQGSVCGWSSKETRGESGGMEEIINTGILKFFEIIYKSNESISFHPNFSSFIKRLSLHEIFQYKTIL